MSVYKRKVFIRKAHRFMGVFIGLQFIFWTLGGLYFSWSDIDEIHGDHQRSDKHSFHYHSDLVNPAEVLSNLQHSGEIGEVTGFKIINILEKPFYQFSHVNHSVSHHTLRGLLDAETGRLVLEIDSLTAIEVAKASFNGEPKLKQIEYITSTDHHHEYRKKPLPAWAVTFDHPTNTTVYIGAQTGLAESFRNDKWRIFDFFWMLHTMDFEGRDNFGNILLRAFSILGLITILSGFTLFFDTTTMFRRRRKKQHEQKVTA
jgi:hypothetical protein